MLCAFLGVCWQHRLLPFAFPSYHTSWHSSPLTQILSSDFPHSVYKPDVNMVNTENTQLLLVHCITVPSGACADQITCQTSFKRQKEFNLFLRWHLEDVLQSTKSLTPLLDTSPSHFSTSFNDFPFLHLLKLEFKKKRFVKDFRRQKIRCVFFKNSSNLDTIGTIVFS